MIICKPLFFLLVMNNCLLDVQVVHFQPHTLFINRIGCSLCLQQCDSQSVAWIHPTDPPKPFGWQSSAKVELLKVCSMESSVFLLDNMIDIFSVTYTGVPFLFQLQLDGYKWSTPFSVCTEGVMRTCLKKHIGNDLTQLRVEVRSGGKNSRYEVIFRPNSLSSPYRFYLFSSLHFPYLFFW